MLHARLHLSILSHKTSFPTTQTQPIITNNLIIMTFQSVLVIGATGRTGGQVIDQLSQVKDGPDIYAFCRNPDKMDSDLKEKCDGILQGNALDSVDLERAIIDSQADMVVISVGNGDNLKKTTTRTDNAKALVAVLSKPQFQNVQVFVVSSDGAGPTSIKVGFGIGKMIEFHLRHILKDHTDQENIFLSKNRPSVRDRVRVVRPTALVDGKTNGQIVTFADTEKSPTIETDRAFLAKWIVSEIMAHPAGMKFGGRTFNVTCVKPVKQ